LFPYFIEFLVLKPKNQFIIYSANGLSLPFYLLTFQSYPKKSFKVSFVHQVDQNIARFYKNVTQVAKVPHET
jgi:hypothetical protein